MKKGIITPIVAGVALVEALFSPIRSGCGMIGENLNKAAFGRDIISLSFKADIDSKKVYTRLRGNHADTFIKGDRRWGWETGFQNGVYEVCQTNNWGDFTYRARAFTVVGENKVEYKDLEREVELLSGDEILARSIKKIIDVDFREFHASRMGREYDNPFSWERISLEHRDVTYLGSNLVSFASGDSNRVQRVWDAIKTKEYLGQ